MLRETPYTRNDMQLVKRLCEADIAKTLIKDFFLSPLQKNVIKEVAILYCKSVGVVPKCNPAYMRVSRRAKVLGLLMLYHDKSVKFNLWITDTLMSSDYDSLEWLKFYDGTDRTAYSILLDMLHMLGSEQR